MNQRTLRETQTLLRSALACTAALAVGLSAARVAAQSTSTPAGPWRIIRNTPSAAVVEYRRHLREDRPEVRGFRVPILADAEKPWPFDVDWSGATTREQQAADLVAKRLAADGLLPTLAAVVRTLGVDAYLAPDDAAVERLKRVGLPTDLLACFSLDGPGADVRQTIASVAKRVQSAKSTDSLNSELRAAKFRFVPADPNFQIATESGEHDFAAIRIQLTSGRYYSGAGDGGSLDVARQLLESMPNTPVIASIESAHLPAFVELLKTWNVARPERLTLLVEPQPVSQWAQDNGKPGFSRPRNADAPRAVLLVPRYASRREDGAVFVPGESFVADGLAAAGVPVIQSSLLYQGGNVLAVRNPKDGHRLLLVGEAEIHRNVTLGLTPNQVREAFRTEFGVDQVCDLPAASFHLDFEVSVRARGDQLVALVNDSAAAARIILRLATERMAANGMLSPGEADRVLQELQTRDVRNFMESFGRALYSRQIGPGQFPLSFSRQFESGPTDSGVGNLQRILVAMDLIAADLLGPEEHLADSHLEAFLRALQRRNADRKTFQRQLQALGMELAEIPSLSEDDRSLTSINGLHDRKAYWMPISGGFFAPLDQAARDACARALGPDVAIIPVRCGETQRRSGGLHCAVGPLPKALAGFRDPD